MKRILLSALMGAACAQAAWAGDVKVSWGKMDDFTDIQASYEHKQVFREHLTQEFEAVFAGLAKKLPEGFTLEVNVKDIDLAGEVKPMVGAWNGMVRVMKPIHWPRLSFEYKLSNAQAEQIASGKEELRDMDYLQRIRMPSGNTSFEFEERMLQEWFRHQLLSGAFPARDTPAIATK